MMRVLIADDHPLVADALEEYLKTINPDLDVARSDSLESALEAAQLAGGFDLTILDLNMAGMNGLEGLTVMRERFPDTPVAIISGFADRREMMAAFDLGATAFIPKDLSGATIIKALELILAGEKYVPADIVAGGGFSVGDLGRLGSQSRERGNPLDALTPREAQVLALLLEGGSNKQIAHQLNIKEITAAFHLKGVFRKLGATNRTQAAAKALKLGWDSRRGPLSGPGKPTP